jgi:hypothetical protein
MKIFVSQWAGATCSICGNQVKVIEMVIPLSAIKVGGENRSVWLCRDCLLEAVALLDKPVPEFEDIL